MTWNARAVALSVSGALIATAGVTAALLAHSGSAPVELAVAWPTGAAPRIETVTVAHREVDDTLARLAEQGAAAGVNRPVRAMGSTQATPASDPRVGEQWGYERLGGQQLFDAGARGQGVVVAVLDTGVDAKHPEFAGRMLAGYDVIEGKEMPTAYDPGGHGTHVAGIIAASADNNEGIAGIAPGATILPVRVLDETGYGDDAGVAQGLVWAVDHGAQVVNMSLGTQDDNPALKAAVEYAASRGVAVVAAAGNDGAGGPISYPAAYGSAFAVAATSASDQHSFFSTTGSYVDVAAPGEMILSTFPDGRYVTMSGTSMATPAVAGAVAVVMARKSVSPGRAVELLSETAVDLGESGRDREFGLGLVSVTEASGVGDRVPPLKNPPGLPGFPGMPSMPAFPSLPAMPSVPPVGNMPSSPAFPSFPALEPGKLPSGNLPSTRPLPAPTQPAFPVLPGGPGELPKAEPPTLVQPPRPSSPPAPSNPQTPTSKPGGPGKPTARAVVALAVSTSAEGVKARVQVAGPGQSGARIVIVDENGRKLATGSAGKTGAWTGLVKARPGSRLQARALGATSTSVTVPKRS